VQQLKQIVALNQQGFQLSHIQQLKSDSRRKSGNVNYTATALSHGCPAAKRVYGVAAAGGILGPEIATVERFSPKPWFS